MNSINELEMRQYTRTLHSATITRISLSLHVRRVRFFFFCLEFQSQHSDATHPEQMT